MHLVIRRISPYTHFDQLIALASSSDNAIRLRQDYIKRIESGQATDLWSEQAYSEVNLHDDVLIMTDVPSQGSAKTMYVVTEFEEAMGQVLRSFKLVSADKASCVRLVKKLEAEERSFAYLLDIDPVEVNTLLPAQTVMR